MSEDKRDNRMTMREVINWLEAIPKHRELNNKLRAYLKESFQRDLDANEGGYYIDTAINVINRLKGELESADGKREQMTRVDPCEPLPQEPMVKLSDVKAIIENVLNHYPVSVWPEPNGAACSEVRYTASGCRLACNNIKIELEKLRPEALGKNYEK